MAKYGSQEWRKNIGLGMVEARNRRKRDERPAEKKEDRPPVTKVDFEEDGPKDRGPSSPWRIVGF